MIEALRRYGPTQPHTGASRRPEILEQLPPLWEGTIATLCGSWEGEKLRILDVGCGTSFEARQCLAGFGADQVESLVCYDPSKYSFRRGLYLRCEDGAQDRAPRSVRDLCVALLRSNGL